MWFWICKRNLIINFHFLWDHLFHGPWDPGQEKIWQLSRYLGSWSNLLLNDIRILPIQKYSYEKYRFEYACLDWKQVQRWIRFDVDQRNLAVQSLLWRSKNVETTFPRNFHPWCKSSNHNCWVPTNSLWIN